MSLSVFWFVCVVRDNIDVVELLNDVVSSSSRSTDDENRFGVHFEMYVYSFFKGVGCENFMRFSIENSAVVLFLCW